MKAKIFYRERVKVGQGGEKIRQPRFRIVAVLGAELSVYAEHLRMEDLRIIAKESGAELVELGDPHSNKYLRVEKSPLDAAKDAKSAQKAPKSKAKTKKEK